MLFILIRPDEPSRILVGEVIGPTYPILPWWGPQSTVNVRIEDGAIVKVPLATLPPRGRRLCIAEYIPKRSPVRYELISKSGARKMGSDVCESLPQDQDK